MEPIQETAIVEDMGTDHACRDTRVWTREILETNRTRLCFHLQILTIHSPSLAQPSLLPRCPTKDPTKPRGSGVILTNTDLWFPLRPKPMFVAAVEMCEAKSPDNQRKLITRHGCGGDSDYGDWSWNEEVVKPDWTGRLWFDNRRLDLQGSH